MKVILTQDVKSQGKKGQLVEVSDGYARNFLLPKKLAVIATAENLNTMKLQEKARKAQEAAEKAEAEATAKKLKDLTVKIAAKAGEGGRLFGAVTAKEVSEALAQQHGVNWMSPSRPAAAIRSRPSWAMKWWAPSASWSPKPESLPLLKRTKTRPPEPWPRFFTFPVFIFPDPA